jgi:ribosomal protein L12E/L44/L45/RPP1/RPP2
MHERQRGWKLQEVMRLVVVSVVVLAEIVSLLPGSWSAVAEASVAAGKNDDKEKKDKKEKKNKDDDRGDDFVLNGQVLEIDTRKDPPEMVVGTVDGKARVRVLKTDEIAINGVGVGDYVELTGEKINELLFEATQISVGQRFSGPDSAAGPPADEAETGDDSSHDDSTDDEDADE